MSLMEELAEPLEVLPPVEFAISYGSGVFPQLGNSLSPISEKPMVDYILGVASPIEWHTKNLDQNPHHYSSWLAKFGGKWVSAVADRVGVGVHFNPYVSWKNRTIKYGVIGMEQLKRDISSWNSFYISGRLQKPVRILIDAQQQVEDMNKVNLSAAFSAALLLSPDGFSEAELYEKICGLSYLGDVRMLFTEDKRKVEKIVRGSVERFRFLYRDAMDSCASAGVVELPASFGSDSRARIVQRGDVTSVRSLLSALPSSVLEKMASQAGVGVESSGSGRNVVEAVLQGSEAQGLPKLLNRAIAGVVRRSSIRQMFSGFLAAGGVNAVHYVARKASKAWQSS